MNLLPATPRPSPSCSGTIVDNVGTVIQGKTEVIELVVLCLVAEGHLLIEDRPGVGKTTMAKALATSIDTTFGRIQFTPDLLPSDVVGVTVFDRGVLRVPVPARARSSPTSCWPTRSTGPRPRPSRRCSRRWPRARSRSTAAPTRCSRPFVVIATQNPLEHEGTYPLPDSQLDRFLMRISMGYPAREDEIAILDTHGETDGLEKLGAVVSTGRVVAMANAVQGVHVAPAIKEYLVDVADATRRHPYVWVGMSPRATLALQRVARARAAAAGRTYVSPDDLKALAQPVLAHRLQLDARRPAAGHLGRPDPAGHPRPGAGAGPGRPVRSLPAATRRW